MWIYCRLFLNLLFLFPYFFLSSLILALEKLYHDPIIVIFTFGLALYEIMGALIGACLYIWLCSTSTVNVCLWKLKIIRFFIVSRYYKNSKPFRQTRKDRRIKSAFGGLVNAFNLLVYMTWKVEGTLRSKVDPQICLWENLSIGINKAGSRSSKTEDR